MRVITIEGPGRNALGTAMMQRLIDELAKAGDEPILLTGAPGAFSAGLDLREVASLDEKTAVDFLRLLERCMSALYLYPGPTAAAVNGHAVAGGCVLTLCCDARIIGDDPSIRIGLNEVALGMRFPPRVLSICRARMSRRWETEVLLGAALMSPTDALRTGLVDAVSADPLATAKSRLEALAAHPRHAYAQTKSDLRGTEQELASDAVLDRWLREAVPVWTAPELRARISAVLQKKPRG